MPKMWDSHTFTATEIELTTKIQWQFFEVWFDSFAHHAILQVSMLAQRVSTR